MEAEIFKTETLDFGMSPEEVIMAQYPGIKRGTHVSDLYMPQLEQDKMAEWMKYNLITFKRMPKRMIDIQLQWIILSIFPRSEK